VGKVLAVKRSEGETALQSINAAFSEYTSFYGLLLEKGLDKTEYSKVFDDITKNFRELYTSAKTNHDALMLNLNQFEEGRAEKDTYERALTRIEEIIIGAEFDLSLKVLPYLKKVEKDLLQDQILGKIEATELPQEIKTLIMEEAQEIRAYMATAEKQGAIEQVKEYSNIGRKIISLGEKAWVFLKKAYPVAVPVLVQLFSSK
jgi:hypothetical protein